MPLSPEVEAKLARLFKYHPPTASQPESYKRIREAGHHLATVILEETPVCADQTAAVRRVREAVMTANAAIATDGAS